MAGDKIAVDFGSFYTNIYKQGYGVVLSEPTVACLDSEGKNKLKAVGKEAKKYIGKTGRNMKIVFPVFEGEIVNEKVAKDILAAFLKKIEFKGGLGSSILFSVPCGAEDAYFTAVEKMCYSLGVSNVQFVETPVLAAFGQNITLNATNPCFIIDMGGGTTNIGMVSLDGVLAGFSVNFGSGKTDADLIDFIAEKFGIQIGLLTAEKLKIKVGSLKDNDTMSMVINGRNVADGKPKTVSVSASDISKVIKKYYDKVADLAQSLLTKLPVEASMEIRENGIYVSGGPSLIYGLEDYFTHKLGMKIICAEDGPFVNVIGAGVLLGKPTLLKNVRRKKES